MKVCMWKLVYGEVSEISSFYSLPTDQPTHFLGVKTTLSTLFCDVLLKGIMYLKFCLCFSKCYDVAKCNVYK